jgi:type II secretory ATPase GspE/PulE/Tfp pilus assembly ATPase PilB-like protein
MQPHIEKIINNAYKEHASDIHIDLEENVVVIKFRIDGILYIKEKIPKQYHNDIVGRIKILAHLRTDEHMLPQDGRFRIDKVDIRVSIVPAYYGESIVMRLLADAHSVSSLSELGFSEKDQKQIIKMLSRSSGMIIVTGPTGSGKTTTLYTLLKILNDTKRSIITIEDPIEYALPGIRQIQTNHQKGLTFATGLRSIVRQDPDVIMVGEIRDAETAYIAIHTALTGHLLLSTLHTNDAASAIPRLIDMGVDPYLISSTIGIVIGQRLVRKACPLCTFGCDACNNESYKGRVGIFEVLQAEDTLREAIMQKAPARILKSIAEEHGMHTMEQDGLDKVEKGITRIEEVVAAIID